MLPWGRRAGCLLGSRACPRTSWLPGSRRVHSRPCPICHRAAASERPALHRRSRSYLELCRGEVSILAASSPKTGTPIETLTVSRSTGGRPLLLLGGTLALRVVVNVAGKRASGCRHGLGEARTCMGRWRPRLHAATCVRPDLALAPLSQCRSPDWHPRREIPNHRAEGHCPFAAAIGRRYWHCR